MRIILYTGKGGVGKTTIAAATALISAKKGYRTLVVSTDTAHSLSDSFDIQLKSIPTKIVDNLWGQEINVLEEIRTHWKELQEYLANLLITKGFNDVAAEELAVLPGMEELSSLFQINEKSKSGDYDCIILDCAPTGESIRFISLPDIMEWYTGKLFSVTRKTGIFKPIINTALVLPGENLFTAINNLFKEMEEIRDILSDNNQTSIRLVVNPEKMVIKEAMRAFTYFNLFGYNVDAVIDNRLLPDNLTDNYFKDIIKIQQKYITDIKQTFSPIPIWEVPMFSKEIVGLTMLEKVGTHLFESRNPLDIFFNEKIQEIYKENGTYLLKLKLPYVPKDKFSLFKKEDELIISIGNFRRSIILPRILERLTPIEGIFKDNSLIVSFKEITD